MDIRFDNAGVDYGTRTALFPLNLTLQERRIGVIGLNGSGKTTFARLINGLVKPTTGRVLVDGLDTVGNASEVLGKVGYIFQSPQNQIILPIVRDDIAYGLKARGYDKTQIEAAVEGILGRFGVGHLGARRAHELSGGELQMAALCSVLVTGPDILILDEPTNQLDLKNRALVRKTMMELPESIIVISHDLPLLEDFERVLLFDQGRLVADAPAEEAIARYRGMAG
ncbi:MULTISPECIES: energy-coupling factor ABC transporter ATP-binding protein [Rhizobium]|uniref:ABC transporter ATP-binding protein n=1 Tax=Rhizobium tropici TaxID=398 RepID=A0A329YFM9_RHITR|nr:MULTISPECIES: energy-coupling factor ABC transporter ATP-binding protein [Rhizobium]MBB3288525.1 biotin transport system ATP-binding protein [Rhizobium sp. BK252]MBB3403338.1 biotin transport system ATP-binding protein [Rhizobium sp. BK289]MBB3415913.1 biotin transport system ATP-binding protein [Rhizobium sp. BK284]MBB3483801.1 biotin transport system ATP-binding protein [Rhizobium sp. BK347]MDK4722221.1 energy-coupling factor ABC transporter ATP-binding protein [Rhizobium sp. CNPSo 3968]